jgi:hypothetical protein
LWLPSLDEVGWSGEQRQKNGEGVLDIECGIRDIRASNGRVAMRKLVLNDELIAYVE